MSVHPAISRLNELPADLDQLVQESLAEGFRFLERFRDEWTSGINCFLLPGEALFQARHQGRLVGICGLNRDPYAAEISVGRVRRLYLVPDARRLGIARRLVSEILPEARSHFTTLRVRTTTREGRLFFEALGFHPITGVPTATHELRLSSDEPTA